jgi:hypothetical protein
MPVKMFKCAVCEEQVSKRKSYLYNKATGERACRKHEETIKKQDEFAAQEEKRKEKEKRDQEIREREKKVHQFGTPEFDQRVKEIKQCCWKCLRQGLHHREFWMRQLIAMKKVEIKEERPVIPIPIGENGISDFKKVMEAMKSPKKDGEHLLYLGQWVVPPDKKEFTMDRIRKRFKDGVNFLGIVQLCPECGDKLGYSIEDFYPKVEDMDLKQMFVIGDLAHQILDPHVTTQAEIELDIEKENEISKN